LNRWVWDEFMRLKFVEPLLPTLVEKPPEGDEWIHEVKFDGTGRKS
jgi:ATP-dependent DNA ligase